MSSLAQKYKDVYVCLLYTCQSAPLCVSGVSLSLPLSVTSVIQGCKSSPLCLILLSLFLTE